MMAHQMIPKLCKENHFPVISLPVNLGLSGGFQTGMKYAYRKGYDCAVQFDADGQHLPEYVETLIKEIKNGSDIVDRFTIRYKEKAVYDENVGQFYDFFDSYKNDNRKEN